MFTYRCAKFITLTAMAPMLEVRSSRASLRGNLIDSERICGGKARYG